MPLTQDSQGNKCPLCSTAVALTEQDHENGLISSLTESIQLHYHAYAVSFYLVNSNKKSKAYQFSVMGEQNVYDSNDLLNSPVLRQCLTNQKHDFEVIDGKKRYYVPMLLARGRLAVLIFDVASTLVVSTDDIAQLVLLYRNCDAHLTASSHDVLTGLGNRKSLNEAMKRIINPNHSSHRRKQDHKEDFVPRLGILDIDFFKRVNDDFGHLYGDEVLLLVTRLMRESFRDDDLLFRYGGEEFVVLLNVNNDEQAITILNRFRHSVENYEFPQVGQVTISIGFVTPSDGVLPSHTFDCADQALYYAKEHGRNQVCCYEQLLVAGKLKAKLDKGSSSEIF